MSASLLPAGGPVIRILVIKGGELSAVPARVECNSAGDGDALVGEKFLELLQ